MEKETLAVTTHNGRKFERGKIELGEPSLHSSREERQEISVKVEWRRHYLIGTAEDWRFFFFFLTLAYRSNCLLR